MYYEERYRRRRRSRYEGPGLLFRLLRLLIALIVVWAIGAAGWTAVVDGGWTQVLLLGVDHDAGGTSRSDTLIIASIGPIGQVRLASVLRDTWVDIPGHKPGKINAAYRYGGPELAMETVNNALGTHIRHYAVVSFRGFPRLIDALGGVDLNVTEAEMQEVNANLSATQRILRKSQVDTSPLTTYGQGVHLTGAQALSFARIRKIGADYQRTDRQRAVLSAMLTQARKCKNPLRLWDFVREVLSVVDTNVPLPHVGMLSVFALINGDVEQMRLPVEGAYESGTYEGTWSIRPDIAKNREALARFLRQ